MSAIPLRLTIALLLTVALSACGPDLSWIDELNSPATPTPPGSETVLDAAKGADVPGLSLGGQADPGHVSSSVLLPTATGNDILAMVVARLTDVSSFEAASTLETSVEALGLKLELGMTSHFVLESPERASALITAVTPGGRLSSEILVAAPDLYMRGPLGDGWARLKGGAVELLQDGFTAVDTLDALGGLFSSGVLPVHGITAERPASDTETEEEFVRLTVSLDLATYWREQPDEVRMFLGSLAEDSLPAGELDSVIDEFDVETLDVWVDNQAFMRRVRIVLNIGDSKSVALDRVVDGINQEYVIALPSRYSDISL